MKLSSSNIIIAAATTVGALVFKFSNSEILAALPVGYIAAGLAAAGLLVLFLLEYAHERAPIKMPRRFVRHSTLRPVSARALGVRRHPAIIEHIAA